MRTISLVGTVGDQQFYFKASMPHRAGETEWHLYIGDLTCGSLILTPEGWKAYMNSWNEKRMHPELDFSSEDIGVMIEEIEKLKTGHCVLPKQE